MRPKTPTPTLTVKLTRKESKLVYEAVRAYSAEVKWGPGTLDVTGPKNIVLDSLLGKFIHPGSEDTRWTFAECKKRT